MKVLIIGASGFIGSRVAETLMERGDEVVVTGRNGAKLRNRFHGRATCVEWDSLAGPLPAEALEGVDGVVNLAGDPVDKGFWTPKKKRRVRDSRVLGTRAVVEAMTAADPKPAVLVSASAIGYYGDRKHLWQTEHSQPDTGFLAKVCVDWEAEAAKARDAGIRTAIVRIGVVLGKGAGAYPKMTLPFRFCLGGQIGLGRAWFSWIHVDDVVGVLLHCLDSELATETYNAVSPNPVSNRELTKTIASVLRTPAFAIVPPIALQLRYGEFGKVITSSTRVRPLRTLGIGYEYKFPELRAAIEDLEAKPLPPQDPDGEPRPEPEVEVGSEPGPETEEATA